MNGWMDRWMITGDDVTAIFNRKHCNYYDKHLLCPKAIQAK